MKTVGLALTLLLLLPFAYTQAEPEQSESAPPLPTHCVHGYSGVFITPTAYMVNPAPEGEFWGKPTISATAAFLRHKDYQSFVITENILGTIELGYALERIGLGDWPSEVRKAGLPRVDNEVYVHNFNLRYALIPEGGFDAKWMPAITVGSHFKWNDGLSTINRQLGGACNQLGADHTFGTEFTLTASKTIVGLLPNPLILSAGLRNSDAIHTGLLGFAGERKTTIEGSAIYFLTDRLLLAAEYRQKPDLIDQCAAGGRHLIKAENDWWDICLAYIINANTTIAGGYANFGNVLNNREDNVWALQLKYEF
jgi:hypothetical protein